DISLPCQCDDEFWQFRVPSVQPPDKSSIMAFFNCLLNLYRILHFTLGSPICCLLFLINPRFLMYAISVHPSTNPSAASQINADLVIWHPDRPVSLFFDQSAVLYCFYFYTRVMIHRAFIPGLFSMLPPGVA
ncbi:hypothetical protein K438DRAFT_1521676, partial [Mycena galopus ATCC 62051]